MAWEFRTKRMGMRAAGGGDFIAASDLEDGIVDKAFSPATDLGAESGGVFVVDAMDLIYTATPGGGVRRLSCQLLRNKDDAELFGLPLDNIAQITPGSTLHIHFMPGVTGAAGGIAVLVEGRIHHDIPRRFAIPPDHRLRIFALSGGEAGDNMHVHIRGRRF